MATTSHMETTVDSHGKQRQVEVFVFDNPAKRKRRNANETKPQQQLQQLTLSKNQQSKMKGLKNFKPETLTLDLEKARREIHSVGISALEGRTKIEAKLAQLKRLGAEIPKNWERKMEKKKQNQEFQRRRQDLKAGIKRKVGDPNKKSEMDKKKKKKEKEDVFLDGQIGKYKHGVQYISQADIHRIKKSKGKR